MRKIKLGLLGFGTVGTGVVKMLINSQALLRSRVGAEVVLKAIADIDIETQRDVTIAKEILTTDAKAVVGDPEIDIIVELIGGKGIAKDLILSALQNGKHVITANKALIASHGDLLFKVALENQVNLLYEASVGGCMPIIKSIRESLIGNVIQSMTGILNGTCNYILSKITDEGCAFETALNEAQQNGYAEADPTLDIEGLDTAHKLAILNAIAYGMPINLLDIYVEGISKITPLDIEFAAEFGYRIKLLAISKMMDNRIEARIHPTMIPCDNLLANVQSTLNAVSITGDAVEEILLYGHGAGMMPTASAIISDLADIAREIISGGSVRIPGLSCPLDQIKAIPVVPISDIETFYYFRFAANDQPGVLSKISGILGNYDISIDSVRQKGRKSKGSVPIVMLTYLAKESNVKNALSEIDGLSIINAPTVVIRIEDQRREM